jgi:hypothetical protein
LTNRQAAETKVAFAGPIFSKKSALQNDSRPGFSPFGVLKLDSRLKMARKDANQLIVWNSFRFEILWKSEQPARN